MKTMSIYEPALCCETGICGVGVDPELIRLSTVLKALKKNGVTVNRYNLTSTPMEFVTNQTVNDYLNERGAEGLPVALLDGEIVIAGCYPSNQEFVALLGVPESYLSGGAAEPEQEPADGGGGCCCSGSSGSGCC